MDPASLINGYDLSSLSVGALGGHSALDTAFGAKKSGFRSVVVAQKGRDATYAKHYRTREGDRGCVDEVITVKKFSDVLEDSVQKQLRTLNTIFLHSRYFWVYFDDFAKVENDFQIPIFGSRHLLRLEERSEKFNQYHLLEKAGIRTPKIFAKPTDIDRLCIVKASEAKRGYERAFFLAGNEPSWEAEGSRLEKEGIVDKSWRKAIIEEFIVGAQVNFNFFYSPLTREVELLGTDMRRQTNLDGFLRMTSVDQAKALKHVELKMVETGHVAVTVKESLLERAFDLGEKFVKATQALPKDIDPTGKGIIGPFALQGAVVAEDGKEDIVIFDVSLRTPGSPGIAATPYSSYLYGHPMTMGERIGREIRQAISEDALEKVLT
ncbi:MAG: DUF1297 domain-containing protein [Candidatus Peregrinibacteria bacterium]|nr:DUF1297 domain-containing protein [Candidatus Peregrinibacteria bacterium]